jgi:hypothetical protein
MAVASLEISYGLIHLPMVAMQQVRLPNLSRIATPSCTTTADRLEQIRSSIGSVLHGAPNLGDDSMSVDFDTHSQGRVS